ncbi:hypothetical protein DID88_007739 [Monilinia fructigena]|uniref:Uncharacterized protein n=1 Tax=Monilinia fructigena TaxID=38457 RepID=A0A395J362_9HELO|nr:hypothetical protein DID88_007739 [Monilinia fructigena]
MTAGASAGYVFANAMIYWVTKLQLGGLAGSVLYIGYSALISFLFLFLLGLIDWAMVSLSVEGEINSMKLPVDVKASKRRVVCLCTIKQDFFGSKASSILSVQHGFRTIFRDGMEIDRSGCNGVQILGGHVLVCTR